MVSVNCRTTALVIVSTLVVVLSATAQEASSCKVEITSPKSGDSVEPSGDVGGKATVPPGKFVWIFAHRDGLAQWWPQSGGPAKVRDGEWHVYAIYGNEKDPAGANFVITAVVVDEKTNDKIIQYVKKSARENYYPGMDLPQRIPDCAPTKDVTVTKR